MGHPKSLAQLKAEGIDAIQIGEISHPESSELVAEIYRIVQDECVWFTNSRSGDWHDIKGDAEMDALDALETIYRESRDPGYFHSPTQEY